VTELCPSECSYEVHAKEGIHFAGLYSAQWNRRGHCSTWREELFHCSACPGAKFDWKLDNDCGFYP